MYFFWGMAILWSVVLRLMHCEQPVIVITGVENTKPQSDSTLTLVCQLVGWQTRMSVVISFTKSLVNELLDVYPSIISHKSNMFLSQKPTGHDHLSNNYWMDCIQLQQGHLSWDQKGCGRNNTHPNGRFVVTIGIYLPLWILLSDMYKVLFTTSSQ